MDHLKDYIVSGGFMIYPILLFSVLALAIMIERSLTLYRIRRPGEDILRALKACSDTQNANGLCAEASKISHPLGKIVTDVFRQGWSEGSRLERKIAMAGSKAIRDLQRFCPSLSLIASLTPLMGLLGTVVGMIKAFMRIYQLTGDVNPSQLAGGIWEALLTTAAGLMVAIPALLAYHVFIGRVDSLMFETRLLLEDLLAEYLPKVSEPHTNSMNPEIPTHYGI